MEIWNREIGKGYGKAMLEKGKQDRMNDEEVMVLFLTHATQAVLSDLFLTVQYCFKNSPFSLFLPAVFSNGVPTEVLLTPGDASIFNNHPHTAALSSRITLFPPIFPYAFPAIIFASPEPPHASLSNTVHPS